MFASLFTATLPLLVLSSTIPSGLVFTRQENPAGSLQIHPSNDVTKCLDLSGNMQENDRPVDLYPCNGTPAQNWVGPVMGGPPSAIQLNGTQWCLDAGTPPFSVRQLKIYQCYNGLAQQTWVATSDYHFALYNQNPGYCLAATDSGYTNTQLALCGGLLQTWTTYPGHV